MAIFCGKCGARLHKKTGLCPRCDKKVLKKCHRRKIFRILTPVLLLLICGGGLRIYFGVLGKPDLHFLADWQRIIRQYCDDYFIVGQETESVSTECGHIWQDATCVIPKTCSLCGQQEGSLLEHVWQEADCRHPKTCTVCGQTEGNALDHVLTEANLQSPPKCIYCGEEFGDALHPYFEENGIVCNMTELEQFYDYSSRGRDDPNVPAEGKVGVVNYQIFRSAGKYKALEGYEWKKITVNFWAPRSEVKNGIRFTSWFFDYYRDNGVEDNIKRSVDEQVQFSVNWNGVEYGECLYEWHTLPYPDYSVEIPYPGEECASHALTFAVRVPVGYDGIVYAAFKRTSEIERLKKANKPCNSVILSADDTLLFRLD